MVEEKPVLEVPKANSRAALAKNMGLRLRASRESIGMAQGEAARRLGYGVVLIRIQFRIGSF